LQKLKYTLGYRNWCNCRRIFSSD